MESFIYNSPLGQLSITANEHSICSAHFISNEVHLSSSNYIVDSAFPSSPLFRQCQQQLTAYFNGTNLLFDLPLEQPGTEFQQKVWAGLLNIKAGATMSYLSFSKQLGNSKATRAVGTANGKNNIAIIVPCHRVIGSNGQLAGYVGGLWRKQWLLQHEAKHCNGVVPLFDTEIFHQQSNIS